MILLLRALARLTGVLLLVILTLAGLAIAIFSIQSGSAPLSLPSLSALAHGPGLRDGVGGFLRQLESHGSPAWVAALSGAGCVLLGLGLFAGAIVPRRERLLILERDSDGTLAARRRAAAAAMRALAEQPRDVRRAKTRLRPWRNRVGGRLRLTVYRARSADQAQVLALTGTQVAPLEKALSLRVRTRCRVPRRQGRVR